MDSGLIRQFQMRISFECLLYWTVDKELYTPTEDGTTFQVFLDEGAMQVRAVILLVILE